jgi:hypothetical protein
LLSIWSWVVAGHRRGVALEGGTQLLTAAADILDANTNGKT